MTTPDQHAARREEQCRHCTHGPDYWNHVRGELFLHEYEPETASERAAFDIYAAILDAQDGAYDSQPRTKQILDSYVAAAIAQATQAERARAHAANCTCGHGAQGRGTDDRCRTLRRAPTPATGGPDE